MTPPESRSGNPVPLRHGAFVDGWTLLSDDGVQCRTWTHRGIGFVWISLEITTKIDRLTLGGNQFANNLVFIDGQLLGNWREVFLEVGIITLCRQRLSPIQSKVKMRATGIKLGDLLLFRTCSVA
jgi:hypothetical protein